MELGDILLCCPENRSAVQHTIFFAQRLAFADADACFTHAAIYAGKGMAFDATATTNISKRSFVDVVGRSHVKALRFPNIPNQVQKDICAEAGNYLGQYSRVKATVDGVLAATGTNGALMQKVRAYIHGAPSNNGNGAVDAPFYCSEFVDAVYGSVLAFSVVGPGIPAPVPAAFSAKLSLTTVPTHW